MRQTSYGGISLQMETQGSERLGSKEIALLASVDACVQRQDGCLMPKHQKVEDRVSPLLSGGVSDSDHIFSVAPAPAGHVTMVLVSVG